MNMTRRQAATIIGLLFSIFVIVGIASYRESGQAQDAGPNRVYVPVVSGVNALAVSSEAEESPIVADVPVEEDKPFGETLPPEVLAQMREEALKMAAEMQIIPASPMALGYSLRRPTISAKTALTMLFLAVRDSILLTLMPQLLGNLHPNRCVLFVGGAGL